MGYKPAISPPVILDTFEDPLSLPDSHSLDKEAIQNTSSSSSDDAEGKGDGKGSSQASIDKDKEVNEDTEIKRDQ